jgi:GNAT superfamily N-acetyltransferase
MAMDFSIRTAAEKDYEGLNALFEEIDEHHRNALPQVFKKVDGPARARDFLCGVMADPNAVIFVAEIQERIIGLAHVFVRPIPEIPILIPYHTGEVDTIIVAHHYRGCGIGKALMEKVEQWAGQLKLERLELSVWNFNKEARDFYQELSYEPAVIRMWKNGPFL